MAESNNHPEAPAGSHNQSLTASRRAAADIQTFLRDMKGKSPEEVLGLDTHGSLTRAVIQATVATLVLLVAFSFGPLVWAKIFPASKPASVKAPANSEKTEKNAELPKASPVTKEEPEVASPTKGDPRQPPGGKDALDKLGVNDTKPANPKVNPLDKGADDLLKDLDKK